MYKFAALALAGGLFAGVAPSAHAHTTSPVLQGKVLLPGGPNGTTCMEPGCVAFFAADCPADLAHANGLTESIIDVSAHAGDTLTFSWADVSTQLHDDEIPWYETALYFYVTSGCEHPEAMNTFALSSYPAERSLAYTLPDDAKWLVVVPVNTATDVSWQADA